MSDVNIKYKKTIPSFNKNQMFIRNTLSINDAIDTLVVSKKTNTFEINNNLDNKLKLRKDYKGHHITKGKNKNYHITFRDFTGKFSLVDYIQIESYKKYYENMSVKENSNLSNCTCIIY